MRQNTWLIVYSIFLIAGCTEPGDTAFHHNPETNLFWQQCPAGQTFENGCNGRPITMTWDEGLSFCANLRDKKQWRLPNRNELLTYHHSQLPKQTLAFTNLYWTSTTNKANPQMAWYLIPGLNWLYFNLKELDGLVVCVANAHSNEINEDATS